MILFHRLTPFAVGLATALGFLSLILVPVHQLISIAATVLVVGWLFGRLAEWKVRTFEFWYFLVAPSLFLLSAFGFILFLEEPSTRAALALLTALVLFFFAEHLFTYLHAPAKYQAYAIEHLSLVQNVLTVFLLSAVGFGLSMFLQTPLWLLSTIFFLAVSFTVCGTLWVSKVRPKQAVIYGLSGALLMTEIFVAMAFLPTSFYANAAVLALAFYLFIGLSRAHFVERLSKRVLRRYIIIGSVLVSVVAGTAQWL